MADGKCPYQVDSVLWGTVFTAALTGVAGELGKENQLDNASSIVENAAAIANAAVMEFHPDAGWPGDHP